MKTCFGVGVYSVVGLPRPTVAGIAVGGRLHSTGEFTTPLSVAAKTMEERDNNSASFLGTRLPASSDPLTFYFKIFFRIYKKKNKKFNFSQKASK